MGRRKIEIQPITHDRNRSVTFLKSSPNPSPIQRKNGLFKKAYELGVLCSVDVCVIVFAHNGKLHEYCSGDSSAVLERRLKYTGDRDIRRPTDFNNSKSNAADKGDSDPEDEGDSQNEDPVRAPGKSKSTTSSKTALGNSGMELPSVSSATSSFPPTGNSNLPEGHSHNEFEQSSGGFNAHHPSSLPPATHPLSIGALGTSYLTSPVNPSPPTTLAQHHQRLAQQFLVNQLQNINPNLNTHPPPGQADSGPNFPFGPLGAFGVPPRGGSAANMVLPFNLGSGAASSSNPSSNAYSAAFLNSLLGTAAAASPAPGNFPNAPNQVSPFTLDWPIPAPGSAAANRLNSLSSTSSSSSQGAAQAAKDSHTPSSVSSASGSPPTRHRQPAVATAATPVVDNTWFELLLGSTAVAMPGPSGPGTRPPDATATLFPPWPGQPNASGGKPSSPRPATPLDGIPIPDSLLALGIGTENSGNTNKRARAGSALAKRSSGSDAMHTDSPETGGTTSPRESGEEDDGGETDGEGGKKKQKR
ncbi:hypothetical protein FRB99_004933 [Tulasnella sp. 403]|nr:hypothetical protein FRB99_004933 [Tulasnella sp. 403]